MTGRGRTTRAGARPESPAAVVSPPRRATRQAVAAAAEPMPPPPTPSRSGRLTRGHVEPRNVPPPRFAAPQPPGSQRDSIASFPTQVTQEDEDEEGEDAENGDGEIVVAPSDSQDVGQFNDDGASQYRGSQDRLSQTRRYASTAAGSDAFLNTPGGSRVRARILTRMIGPLATYAEVVQELLYNFTEDAAWKIEYEKMFGYFVQARHEFQRELYFINEATIFASLDVDPGSPAAYKTSRTLALANLASFLADIHTVTQERPNAQDLVPVLQAWDDAFPSKFLPLREPNQPLMAEENAMFDLAIRIRIQRTIYTLEDDGGDKELLSLIDAIWVNPSGISPRLDLLAFLNGSAREGKVRLHKRLAGIALNDGGYAELRKEYIAHLRRLYSSIANVPLASAIAWLKKEFPIDGLLDDLQRWSFIVFRQILQVADSARASAVPQETPSRVASQLGDSQSNSQVDPRIFGQSIVRAPPSLSDAEPDLAALQELRQFEAQAQAHPSQSPASSEIIQKRRELMPSSIYPPPSEFGYSQESPTPAQQNNGIQFAHSAASFAGPASSPIAVGSKRPRNTQDSDDGAFETDTRQLGGNQQRRRGDEVAETPPRPRKRARKAVEAAAVIPAPGATAGPSSGDGQRVALPASTAASEPDLAALSQRARELAIVNRRPREPQTRTPWSRNDCKALIRAVDVFKAKWSRMEQQIAIGVIEFEHPRDQQALRDKARLLKQDMLKTDILLPPSFDLVVLGKKERQAVIACGKNPDRREMDVDQDGRVINTVYVGE